MRIFKTCVYFSGEPEAARGNLWLVDTIEHEGELWLVPGWLEAPHEGWKSPKRIICLSRMQHQATPEHPRYQFATREPLPTSVYEGLAQSSEEAGFLVVEAPNIRFEIPKGVH